MTFRGACGSQDALKIHAGYDILVVGILVSIPFGRIEGLKARRKDNGTHVQINGCFRLIKIDRVVFAKLLTSLTLTLFTCVDGLEIQTGISVNGILQGYGLGKGDIDGLAFI